MKLSDLKVNPKNPQIFNNLDKLINSIIEFPKMMELRPLIYEGDTNYVLGGNKRLISLNEIKLRGYDKILFYLKTIDKEDNIKLLNPIFNNIIPNEWVISASNLNSEEKKRFVLADNIGFGEWDLDMLISDYSEFNFDELGLDIDYGEDDKENNESENNEDSIDYDFPIAKELDFCDEYIILTFSNKSDFNNFIEKNNIGLERSSNFKSDKLVEFEHKRIFNYGDLHTIIKQSD